MKCSVALLYPNSSDRISLEKLKKPEQARPCTPLKIEVHSTSLEIFTVCQMLTLLSW